MSRDISPRCSVCGRKSRRRNPRNHSDRGLNMCTVGRRHDGRVRLATRVPFLDSGDPGTL